MRKENMPPVSKNPLSPKISNNIENLVVEAFDNAITKKDISPFLSNLLTLSERRMIAKRLSIAFLLIRGDYNIRSISGVLKVSTNTIARVNLILNTSGFGYRKVLVRLMKKDALKSLLNELSEALSSIPPKGTNWSDWHKNRKSKRISTKRF